MEPEIDFNRRVKNFLLNNSFGTHPDVQLSIGAKEKRALDILERTTRFADGRVEVGLPWQMDNVCFKDKSGAMRRLLTVERRPSKDPYYVSNSPPRYKSSLV